MRIVVKTLLQKRFTVEVEETTTVAELKQKLMAIEGLPVSSQRLIFQGQWLQKEVACLQEYGTYEGCLVHLSVPQGLVTSKYRYLRRRPASLIIESLPRLVSWEVQ